MATLSQLPDVVDLAFVAGDTFRIRVRIIDPTTGSPQTLTLQHKIEAWIAKEDGHTNVADFDVTKEADNLSVILTLSPKETEMIFTAKTPGTDEFHGKWDLEVTFPPVAPAVVGDVRTVAKGTVTIVDDITNSGSPSPPPEPLP